MLKLRNYAVYWKIYYDFEFHAKLADLACRQISQQTRSDYEAMLLQYMQKMVCHCFAEISKPFTEKSLLGWHMLLEKLAYIQHLKWLQRGVTTIPCALMHPYTIGGFWLLNYALMSQKCGLHSVSQISTFPSPYWYPIQNEHFSVTTFNVLTCLFFFPIKSNMISIIGWHLQTT